MPLFHPQQQSWADHFEWNEEATEIIGLTPTGRATVDAFKDESSSLKMSRHHVHLSKDVETARKVGMRHGRPVILAIAATAMQQAGFTFYCSDNSVWLVDQVPPQYLKILSPEC